MCRCTSLLAPNNWSVCNFKKKHEDVDLLMALHFLRSVAKISPSLSLSVSAGVPRHYRMRLWSWTPPPPPQAVAA